MVARFSYMCRTLLFRVEEESTESVPGAARDYYLAGITSDPDLVPCIELHSSTTGWHVTPRAPCSNIALADAALIVLQLDVSFLGVVGLHSHTEPVHARDWDGEDTCN